MRDAPRPLNRVVVGVDFASESTAAAIWTACWLVRDAEVVLVHAVRAADTRSDRSRSTATPHVDLGAQARAVEQRLRELSHGLSADFVWCEVRDGNAADAMLATVTEFRADLVVTGAPDEFVRSGDGRESSIMRLVRCSNVPVVMAGGRLEHRPRRILALADDDTPSVGVMHCARALGAPHDADVTLLSHTSAWSTECSAATQWPGAPNGLTRGAPVRPLVYARSLASEGWRGTRPTTWPDWPDAFEAAADGPDSPTPDLVVMSNAATRNGTLPWVDRRVTALVSRTRCPVVVVPGAWTGPRD